MAEERCQSVVLQLPTRTNQNTAKRLGRKRPWLAAALNGTPLLMPLLWTLVWFAGLGIRALIERLHLPLNGFVQAVEREWSTLNNSAGSSNPVTVWEAGIGALLLLLPFVYGWGYLYLGKVSGYYDGYYRFWVAFLSELLTSLFILLPIFGAAYFVPNGQLIVGVVASFAFLS
jgi:hypothetical protein